MQLLRLNLAARLNFWLLAMSLLAAGILLFTTKDGGIGLTTDSVNYIAASKSLLAGEGYSRYGWNLPFASWPPLYPTILAGVNIMARWLNLDILEAIRWTNALVFAAIMLLSGGLFRRILRSPLFIVLGTASVALAFPLLTAHVYVWSEPVYILLSLLFLLYLPTFLEQHRPYQFVVLVVIAALGTMQRYAAIGIIPFGVVAIVLFLRDITWVKRLLVGAAFGISGIPYVLWLLYIRTLTTPTILDSPDPMGALVDSLALTPVLLAEWFVPVSLHSSLVAGGLVVAIVLVIIYAIVDYVRAARMNTAVALRNKPVLIAVYILIYMGFYYFSHLLIYSLDLDQRHFSVMIPFVMLLVFWGIEQIAGQAEPYRWRYIAAVIISTIWLIYPASATGNEVLFRQFWCCEGTRRYRHLPMIEWLNQQGPPGLYFSNAPIPLFYTPFAVFAAPYDADTLEVWTNTALDSGKDVFLIHFEDSLNLFYQGSSIFYYNFDYPTELQAAAHLDLLVEFEESKLYRVRSRS